MKAPWPRYLARILALGFPVYAMVVAFACVNKVGDVPADSGVPTPLGSGSRIKDVTNPNLPNHPVNGAAVSISGVVTLTVDGFDETRNGKSLGELYVQDVDSTDPWSGLDVHQPAFVPADLHVAPGDVLDLVGPYQEDQSIGTAIFPDGDILPELYKPVGTFRYEYKTPPPAIVNASDLGPYETGRQWLAMLVTIQNVTIPAAFVNDAAGRVTAFLTSNTGMDAPQISNELYELDPSCGGVANTAACTLYPACTHFSSVTGIVTYFGFAGEFYDFHVAPRSPADLVVESSGPCEQ